MGQSKVKPLLHVSLGQKWLLLLHNCFHPCTLQAPLNCMSWDRVVGNGLKCFGYVNCSFSLSRGDEVDCMMDVGGRELLGMTSSWFWEGRKVFRVKSGDSTNADTSYWGNVWSGMAIFKLGDNVLLLIRCDGVHDGLLVMKRARNVRIDYKSTSHITMLNTINKIMWFGQLI